jgi:hypothetical protein
MQFAKRAEIDHPEADFAAASLDAALTARIDHAKQDDSFTRDQKT